MAKGNLNYLVWLFVTVVPIFLIFLFWNLGYIPIGLVVGFGLFEWLYIRPKINIWRLRHLGIKKNFTFWQSLNLMFSHAAILWRFDRLEK